MGSSLHRLTRAKLLLALVSVVLSVLFAEAGYRVWLVLKLYRLAQPLTSDLLT